MLLSGWKKVLSVSLAVILIFTGVGGNGFAVKAEAANQLWADLDYHPTCGTKKIKLHGEARGGVKPTGVEIYRSGKRKGNYKKIGIVRSFVRSTYKDGLWYFSYKDTTVKTGQVYYYKCRAYQKTGNTTRYQKTLSCEEKAIAARTVGKYTCRLIMSNHEKLLFKLTGTKNNGPLKSVKHAYFYGFLIYKNKGGKAIKRWVRLTQFSYDGTVWFRGSKIETKGEESIYLGVEDIPFNDSDGDGNNKENIDVSGYQYVQLLFDTVRYNSYQEHLRLNFTTGQALTGDFTVQKSGDYGILWDGDIFGLEYDIPGYY